MSRRKYKDHGNNKNLTYNVKLYTKIIKRHNKAKIVQQTLLGDDLT